MISEENRILAVSRPLVSRILILLVQSTRREKLVLMDLVCNDVFIQGPRKLTYIFLKVLGVLLKFLIYNIHRATRPLIGGSLVGI